jgi:hypothetical protein
MADKVEGLDELVKQIGRIGKFPKEMSRDLRKANREIGTYASKKLKAKLRPRALGEDFKVYKGTPGPGRARKGEGVVRITIPSGTLWRSIGVKNARGSRINVFVGPRYGGKSVRMDGFFAHMVEAGDVGGRSRSIGSKSSNIIVPMLMRFRGPMERLMIMKYRKVFDKFKL